MVQYQNLYGRSVMRLVMRHVYFCKHRGAYKITLIVKLDPLDI